MGIQSTGIGSGLDVNSLLSKLMAVEAQPLTTLAKKEASFQAKLSAYGSLNGALSSFQNSLASVNSASTFQSLTANSTDTTIASASTTSIATAGTYNINVTKLAQAQILSSAGQASTTATIGDGSTTTLTFQFGTITGTAASGTYPPSPATSFAQDASQSTGTVTIDSSNNTLQGIRDAINAAKIGVSASIVGDGNTTNPYHLVLSSAKTGVSSSLKIIASGTDLTVPSVASLLNYDPAGTQAFTEVATAQNAELKINGIDITSNTNSITGAIQGVTLNASKIGNTTITVAANPTAIQAGIAGFVKAYNDLTNTITGLTAFDAASKKGGLLLGDSTTRSIQNQIRNTLSTAVNGLDGGLTTLSQIGITVQKDGTLSLNSTKLTTALTNSISDVGGLFTAIGKSTDSLVSITGSTSATKGGAYTLNVVTPATQGGLTGTGTVLPPLTTINPGATLNVTLDGVSSAVSITAGSYTPTQLSALLQSTINGTSAFNTAGLSLKASVNGSGYLVLQSNKYGSVSNVSLADGTELAAKFTDTTIAGTAGVDIAGTLNGIAATGSGQTLTGATGSDAQGLSLLVTATSAGARGTVNFSRGYADTLSTLLKGFLGSTGTINSTTDGVSRSIADIGKQREQLNSRLFDVEKRYRAQFTNLDKIISSMSNTSTFLTQQLSALTNSNLK